MFAWATMTQLSDKLKAIRTERALTQEDLAAMAGLGLSSIQRAERGASVSSGTIASIAAALDVPASTLGSGEAARTEPYLPLLPITTGRELIRLVRGVAFLDFGFGDIDDLDDAQAVEDFEGFCRSAIPVEQALSPTTQVRLELAGKEALAALAGRGLRAGGAQFEVTAYEVDDDGGGGLQILLGQWDELRAALRVGRTADEVARAEVGRGLGPYEVVKGSLVDPGAAERDAPSAGEDRARSDAAVWP